METIMSVVCVVILVAALAVLACPARAAAEDVIGDKTLVVWAAPDDLGRRGGSALTIERAGGVFDAVVFGEIAEGRWMAGSNMFSRTNKNQDDLPPETVTGVPLQIAVVYAGNSVTLYREGEVYDQYTNDHAETFGADSKVLFGLRHVDANGENRYFTGAIADVRIYDRALSQDEVAALRMNEPSDPAPLAWWNFADGRVSDAMGVFSVSTLIGDARVDGGRLVLGAPGAYLLAARTPVALGSSTPAEIARGVRERIASDPSRPGYHFAIPEGPGMPFDPNGAIYWKGRYHLFYIFQDSRSGQNDHHWGHVSSRDLFHWRHHPTGLVGGMFSGNAFVNKDGRPTMCYHQVGLGNAMAVALDDDLNTWEKLPQSITPDTQEGDPHHGLYRSWDPYGWLEGDTYYAIFGGERPGLVKSATLEGPWSYVGDLLANTVPGVSINEDVSCADFFEIGGKHMLLCISHRLGARYYLGEWKDEQFHPDFHSPMSWKDNAYFAPESLLDDRGRRIMWAWIFDEPGFGARMEYGWSGTMSLPRVLWLGDDGMLRMDVPEEIEALRYDPVVLEDITVGDGEDLTVAGVEGNSLELFLEIDSDAARYGLKVCVSGNGGEQTPVYFDAEEGMLKVDTRQSGPDGTPKDVEAGPLTLEPGEPLRLRVFVDKSVVEVFANQRQGVMRRIYPAGEDSVGVRLFAEGGSMTVRQLKAWRIEASNPY